MNKTYLLFFLLVFSADAKHGPKVHAIDIVINECYNQNPTNLGFITCELNGYEMWYKEMEKTYDKLMSLLEDNQKEILKNNQIEWDKMRVSSFALNETIYDENDQILIIASGKTDFVRKRTKDLLIYLDFLKRQAKK